jgi:hypothetical protein
MQCKLTYYNLNAAEVFAAYRSALLSKLIFAQYSF